MVAYGGLVVMSTKVRVTERQMNLCAVPLLVSATAAAQNMSK